MGNGSALEVVLHDYAQYKSTFTLLYFTLPIERSKVKESKMMEYRLQVSNNGGGYACCALHCRFSFFQLISVANSFIVNLLLSVCVCARKCMFFYIVLPVAK